MNRRDFIAGSIAAGAVAASGSAALGSGPITGLPRRRYGNTDRELSVIGFGGIVVMNETQARANHLVANAVERGVSYFDVAPSYGNAQDRLGPALKPFRNDVFLACKTAVRDAAGARAELENSLRVLQTDHVDLYQLHGLAKREDFDAAFGPGGAIETFVAAQQKGLARNLGFSAHDEDVALMAMDAFDFASVLFPFNCVTMVNGHFGHRVLRKAREKGVACLALKALAWRPWPEGAERTHPKCWYQPITDPDVARLALTYTLDLPVVAALPPGDPRLFELALRVAADYRPLAGMDRVALDAAIKGVPPIFGHPE